MTPHEKHLLYLDLEEAMRKIQTKWGRRNGVVAGAFVVGCADGDFLIMRGAPGETSREVAGAVAPLLRDAAQALTEQAAGLQGGKLMGESIPGKPQ